MEDDFSREDEPLIIIGGPEEISVSKQGLSIIRINVEGFDFSSATKCEVQASDDSLLRVKPKRFILTPSRLTKTILAKIPKKAIKTISKHRSEENVGIDVDCTNGAFETLEIFLIP